MDLSSTESCEQIAKNVKNTNFLEWTSMRHSIPTNGGVFDIAKKKSKDYYPFLIKKKACLPNYAQKLKLDFNLSNDDLRKAFLLPHSIVFEPYVKAFQFKIRSQVNLMNTSLT